MVRLRTVFYCGHESRYGLAHLEPLLRSAVFEVQAVVLAQEDRWRQFHSKLSGVPAVTSLRTSWAFRQRTNAIQRTVRKFSRANLRTVYDVNHADEVRYAAHFDLAVCAAYPQIFSPALLSAPKRGAINFHPSYLPRCRGAHPVYWTIASEEPYGGVSCHFMETTIDTGSILAQHRIDFDKRTVTYNDLYQLVEAQTPNLCREVEAFFVERREAIPQQGAPSYFRNEKEADRKVCFANETVERASAKVRAGRAFVICESGRMVSLGPPASVSTTLNQTMDGTPGRIVRIHGDTVTVAGKNGYLTCKYRIAPQSTLMHRILRKLHAKKGLETQALQSGESLSEKLEYNT